MKTSPTKKHYSVKKQKDGDYEVTLHNQTRTFFLKEVVMNYIEAQKALKQTLSQRNLDKAVLQNTIDAHSDVVKMFKKLPKVKQTALLNYFDIQSRIGVSETKYREAKKTHDRLKKQLADIHEVIPSEQKKLTKSELRRINAMKK